MSIISSTSSTTPSEAESLFSEVEGDQISRNRKRPPRLREVHWRTERIFECTICHRPLVANIHSEKHIWCIEKAPIELKSPSTDSPILSDHFPPRSIWWCCRWNETDK